LGDDLGVVTAGIEVSEQMGKESEQQEVYRELRGCVFWADSERGQDNFST
jgi:hypothetical protein